MMKRKAEYVGIDYFRMIAAVLVVAIHTSPLLSYNETADFVLTRVIARVSVPFFFMTTGFFLLPQYLNNSRQKELNPKKIVSFVKKTAIIYGIAILVYFPVNLYAGNVKWEESLSLVLLKQILFEGTFYHLWYLPASILGVILIYLLLSIGKASTIFIVTIILFIIGLFGDSYYGIIEQVPELKNIYTTIFLFSDYTRNGIFFAPVFLMMGGLIAKQKEKYCLRKCLVGLSISMILMIAEAILLHTFKLQRHDSMYFMLLPCMFFLIQLLLLWKGPSYKNLRNISLLIYLIHPMMIIVVRGFAKVVGIQDLLIGNSVIHYVVVTVVSWIASVIIIIFLRKRKGVSLL